VSTLDRDKTLSRYMTLETLAEVGDNPNVSPPAVAA
jgi:hypothetical protein